MLEDKPEKGIDGTGDIVAAVDTVSSRIQQTDEGASAVIQNVGELQVALYTRSSPTLTFHLQKDVGP